MSSHDEAGHLRPNQDWSLALKYLETAVTWDPTYAPAYYLRGKIRASNGQLDAAVDDLKKAVNEPEIGYIPCVDINDPSEVDSAFPALKEQQRFKDLQQNCKFLHRIGPRIG